MLWSLVRALRTFELSLFDECSLVCYEGFPQVLRFPPSVKINMWAACCVVNNESRGSECGASLTEEPCIGSDGCIRTPIPSNATQQIKVFLLTIKSHFPPNLPAGVFRNAGFQCHARELHKGISGHRVSIVKVHSQVECAMECLIYGNGCLSYNYQRYDKWYSEELNEHLCELNGSRDHEYLVDMNGYQYCERK